MRGFLLLPLAFACATGTLLYSFTYTLVNGTAFDVHLTWAPTDQVGQVLADAWGVHRLPPDYLAMLTVLGELKRVTCERVLATGEPAHPESLPAVCGVLNPVHTVLPFSHCMAVGKQSNHGNFWEGNPPGEVRFLTHTGVDWGRTTVVVVGGNLGRDSDEFLHRFAPRDVVIFEPIEQLARDLIDRYAPRPNVRVFDFAVDGFSGQQVRACAVPPPPRQPDNQTHSNNRPDAHCLPLF